jgi:hypothetical protein
MFFMTLTARADGALHKVLSTTGKNDYNTVGGIVLEEASHGTGSVHMQKMRIRV